MEKQIRIISKVFFFVALCMLLSILVNPLQAWSDQGQQNPVRLSSSYQQAADIIEKQNSTDIPSPAVSKPVLTVDNRAAGKVAANVVVKPVPANQSVAEASSDPDRQKLLLMLLLLASSNKLPGS